MVEVRRGTSAGSDAVWDVLADGWLYPTWVVGASRMRAVDPAWPAVGAVLHHSVGSWPLLIDDTTSVLVSRPGHELMLRARAWPTGEAEIQLLLEPAAGGGCEIVMREDPVAGPARLLPPPVRWAMLRPRNNESLTRLSYLAERRSR